MIVAPSQQNANRPGVVCVSDYWVQSHDIDANSTGSPTMRAFVVCVSEIRANFLPIYTFESTSIACG